MSIVWIALFEFRIHLIHGTGGDLSSEFMMVVREGRVATRLFGRQVSVQQLGRQVSQVGQLKGLSMTVSFRVEREYSCDTLARSCLCACVPVCLYACACVPVCPCARVPVCLWPAAAGHACRLQAKADLAA